MKQRSFRRFSTYCLSLGLGLLGLGTRLHAGNLEKFALGEDAGLSAGAVAATTADSGSLYYNPAGLARLSKDSVDLGVSAYAARFFHIPRLLQITLPDRKVAMDFEGTAFFSTPAAVIFGLRLDEGLGLGLAVFTRDQLDLTGRLSERFIGMDGAQAYEYEQGMELDFRFKNYLAGLGLGWAPWPGKLNVGMSVLGEYGRQSVSTQFWGDYRDPNSYNAGTQLYGTRLTTTYKQAFGVSSYGARAIAGLQWNLAGPLQLGLVARSPRFAVYNEIEADILLDGNFVPAGAVVRVHVDGDGTEHPYVWHDPWRPYGALALAGPSGWIAAQVDASDRPDDEGRGARWNYKLGGILHLSPNWDLGAGAYTDLSWGETPQGFGGSDMDYYGAHSGLRWKRLIGGSEGKPGNVELSTSLILRYERGYGALNGADIHATTPVFPLASAPTAAVFEEANALLTSGLAW